MILGPRDLLTVALERLRATHRAIPAWAGYAYAGPADFVLQHGRFYEPGPLEDAKRHYPLFRQRWHGEQPLENYEPSPALVLAMRCAKRRGWLLPKGQAR